jgi:hypothetical protein
MFFAADVEVLVVATRTVPKSGSAHSAYEVGAQLPVNPVWSSRQLEVTVLSAASGRDASSRTCPSDVKSFPAAVLSSCLFAGQVAVTVLVFVELLGPVATASWSPVTAAGAAAAKTSDAIAQRRDATKKLRIGRR